MRQTVLGIRRARATSVRRTQLCRSCMWISMAALPAAILWLTIPATTMPISCCCGSAPLMLACNGSIRKLIFRYDRPIFSPDSPTSLTAVAVPALAWSGNLWTWNPQLGVTQNFGSHDSPLLQLQAALIDVGDAPLSPRAASSGNSPVVPPASSEESRWPGVEARVALLGRHSSSDDEYSGHRHRRIFCAALLHISEPWI